MKLIEANGRNIQLTEAGEALAAHSRRLFAMEAEMEDMMQAIKSGREGSLRICATELPETTLLPGWVVGYKQQNPRMDVKLLKGNSNTALQRLRDHSVHISIVCGSWSIEDELIESFTIMEDELIFAVPGIHRLAGKEVTRFELMEEPFVLREEGSYTRKEFMSLLEASGIRGPRSTITIEGLKETIEAVKAGYGAALVPALSIKTELASGELSKVKVTGVTIRIPYGCVPTSKKRCPHTSVLLFPISRRKSGKDTTITMDDERLAPDSSIFFMKRSVIGIIPFLSYRVHSVKRMLDQMRRSEVHAIIPF